MPAFYSFLCPEIGLIMNFKKYDFMKGTSRMDKDNKVQSKQGFKDSENTSSTKKVSSFEKNIRPRVKAIIEQVRKKNEKINKRGR